MEGGGLTDHLEVDVAGDAGLDGESGGEVPAAEVERRADDQVRDLARGLRADECEPVVRLGLDTRHVSIVSTYTRFGF